MEGNCCTPPSLAVIIILVLFPVKSWGEDEPYKLPREASENAVKKRFHPIDSDIFVGLMGKRAPERSRFDSLLAALLRQRRECCPSTHKYLQKWSCRCVICRKQRTQPTLLLTRHTSL